MIETLREVTRFRPLVTHGSTRSVLPCFLLAFLALTEVCATAAGPSRSSVQARRPALPAPSAVDASAHPIDRLLLPYFQQRGLRVPLPVEDRLYARRVYLDVIGLLPTPGELKRFVDDSRPDKRPRLVRTLLADRQRYAEHWITFWNDLLRNDYRGTGYIDGGRKQITPWLYAALFDNVRFDRFVSGLVDPTPDSEGFVRGIVWRGAINASQTPAMQAAQNIPQVFLGINLKCASCHDSFINRWKLADAYGLAGIYADEPLEMFRCDTPTGTMAIPKFLYPEVGAIDAAAARPQRVRQLAALLTSPRNGRLSRTIVNRLWARFFGRGLVEPVDDLDAAAWNPDLLEWLAADLVDNSYDLKKTIERILTSRAYQLPAVDVDEQKRNDYVFRGPAVRRLSAEQYLDALSALTGVWGALPANSEIDFSGFTRIDKAARAAWIWTERTSSESAETAPAFLRKTVVLPELPDQAALIVACDKTVTLFINGKEFPGKDFSATRVVDIRSYLVRGANTFAVATGKAPGGGRDRNGNTIGPVVPDRPAGLLLYARLRGKPSSHLAPKVWDFASDSSWYCSGAKTEGWERTTAPLPGWRPAAEVADAADPVWNHAKKFRTALSVAAQYGRVRAALVAADALMVALGRPNREQVVTSRPSAATTLQALELTNGATLAKRLERGAEKIAAHQPSTGPAWISQLYLHALGRRPRPAEFALARDLVATPARREGIEDLLWIVTVLPEFQLIH